MNRFALMSRPRRLIALTLAATAGCASNAGPALYEFGQIEPAPTPVVDDWNVLEAQAVAAPATLVLQPATLAVGKFATTPALIDSPVPTRTLNVIDAPPPGRHQVQAGQTLAAISRDRLGNAGRWREVVALNPGLTPDRLRVGQTLILPAR